MLIEVGQIWNVYSQLAKRWTPATIIEISGEFVVLQYRDIPQTLQCDLTQLRYCPEQFQLVESHA